MHARVDFFHQKTASVARSLQACAQFWNMSQWRREGILTYEGHIYNQMMTQGVNLPLIQLKRMGSPPQTTHSRGGGAWGGSAKKCQNWCTLHNINQVCEGFDHHFLMNVLFVVDSVEMCNCNIAQLFRQPVCTILLLPPTFLKMKMGNNELTWTLVFPSWEMSFTNSMLGNACKTFSNAKEAYGLFINEQPPYSAIAPTLNRFYRDDLESSGYVTEAYNLCTVVNWPRRTPCAIALYSRTVIYCKQKTEHFSKFHMHDFSIHKQASTVRCVSW